MRLFTVKHPTARKTKKENKIIYCLESCGQDLSDPPGMLFCVLDPSGTGSLLQRGVCPRHRASALSV